ncbi:MAG: outer membrane protein assembly factor BamB [Pseudomonadota bacterium]
MSKFYRNIYSIANAKRISFLFLCVLLTACAGLGDDNTPSPAALTSYSFQFQPALLWSVATGRGMNKDFLRLGPVIKKDQVFVANKSGYLASVALRNGHKLWQVNLKQRISSAPAVDKGIVVLASMKPQLIALQAESGDLLWRASLPNQVLASPAINQDRVVVKTVDGQVLAFALRTGQLLWSYSHGAPTLVLRPSSAPQIIGNKVLIGFSDGTLSALSLRNGGLLWERTIAFPKGVTQADQLVDIAADPLLDRQIIYVVTYQGELAAIALQTGQIRWQRPFSSYSGLALGKNLFISDSDGGLWSFNRSTGQLLWHNSLLQNRGLTAPVIMGNSLVLGDKEGYLHWFAQADGRPLARVLVHDNASIVAAPSVAYPLVCVLTQQGGLSAWTQTTMPI